MFKAYRRLWLDFLGNTLYLDSILRKGWAHTPRAWKRLLALSFSELQWSEKKHYHGILNDWADLARATLGEKSVKVINGTLRTASRDMNEKRGPSQGLPKILEKLLGGEEGRMKLEGTYPLYAFSPSAQHNPSEEMEGVEILELPDLGSVHQLLPGTSPQIWTQKAEGFIQNLSAAEVAKEVNQLFTGSEFLDYCAAPGGKSWQLLRLGFSHLTYHDHSPKRLKQMKTSSMGQLFNSRLACLNSESDDLFDGVLIDVPCSNSGVLAKCPEAVRHYWEPSTDFSEIQEEVFVAGLNRLKPGGQLFYSTCSIDPVENRERVSFLSSRYGLKVNFTKSWFPDEKGRHGAFLAELKNCE